MSVRQWEKVQTVEGAYQGHHVWLRVLAEAPDDEEPGLQLDISRMV